MSSQSALPEPQMNPPQPRPAVSPSPVLSVSNEALIVVLTAPDPTALRRLQGDLLQSGLSLTPETWKVLTDFHDYLVSIVTRTTSREYSHLASMLDMGAVGIVALQHVLSARGEEDFWWTFLLSALSEGLMVTAARQYVKAWEGEMAAVHEQAAWKVQQAFWDVSQALRPQLDPAERRQYLDQLIAPLYNNNLNSTLRAILLIRFFQVLLLARLYLDLRGVQ
jgi:hypothetical protein